LCLIVLAWRARADLPLVVAANRDEWRERESLPAQWWPDHPQVFAGRDLKAGGTWMGVSRSGRFAAITNFRDPADRRSTARSRGEIVSAFLAGMEPPREFLASLASRSADYNGFNLVAGDRESLWYFGSREGTAREIDPGVHGLSNHLLDEPWPKVVHARTAMEASLMEEDPATRLFAALAEAQPPPDESLPATGVGIAWERRLGPALILGPDYGTLSTTFVSVGATGNVRMEERTLDEEGRVVTRRLERFSLLAG
jgi:uncharacterized protein with NRDE domain